jgi:2-polyprenyl-3-methyl-5-hydroxy-6-metoxy-1,4-benzoquinol methylase
MSSELDHGQDDLRDLYSQRNLSNEFWEIEPYLRGGMKVLDAGCGPGTITLEVAKRVLPGKVIGFDSRVAVGVTPHGSHRSGRADFPASGSSDYGFAAKRYALCTMCTCGSG